MVHLYRRVVEQRPAPRQYAQAEGKLKVDLGSVPAQLCIESLSGNGRSAPTHVHAFKVFYGASGTNSEMMVPDDPAERKDTTHNRRSRRENDPALMQ